MSPSGPIPFDDASELAEQAWQLLAGEQDALHKTLVIQPVGEFLRAANQARSSRADREGILDQSAVILQNLYPHLPFKMEIYPFAHPIEFLETNVRPVLDELDETGFHASMIAAFSLVRDAHTLYMPPAPFRGATALLPFQLRHYADADGRRYVVSRVMNGFDHPDFRPGAEILRWGSESIDDHVQRTAARLPGGNPDAVFTRGTMHATIRPLSFTQPPFDDELPAVNIEYRTAGNGELRAIRVPWKVVTGLKKPPSFTNGKSSLSFTSAAMTSADRILHHRPEAVAERNADAAAEARHLSTLPDVFDAQHTGGAREQGSIDTANLVDPDRPEARFGYLRIKAFTSKQADADGIVEEFRRLLGILDAEAPDGLVLDIRGNPGGSVHAAERMLQMLTPGRITPSRFHYANTAAVLAMLRKLKAAPDAADFETQSALEAWLDNAANQPLETGPRLTSGHPLTSAEEANDTGQVYHGPVALLIDALTYSAADIFAAGFQDHRIGPVMGVDERTGGGGANSWTYEEVITNLKSVAGIPLPELPAGATLTLAIRRCSRLDDRPVEDVGVRVDIPSPPESAEEVLNGYPGLLRRACRELSRIPARRIDAAQVEALPDGRVSVSVRARNLDLLKFLLDGAPALSTPAAHDTEVELTLPAVAGESPSALRIEGYTLDPSGAGELKAVRLIRSLAPAASRSS